MNLRGRVTLATVVTLSVGLAIVGVALNLLLANRLIADAETVLDNRAAALLATLDTTGPQLRVHDNAGDAVLDEQAWVFDAAGRAVERPPVDDESDAWRTAARVACRRRGRSRTARGCSRCRLQRGRGTVVVGVSLGPYERTKHLAALGTLLFTPVRGRGRRAARAPRGRGGAAAGGGHDDAGRGWSEHDLDRRFALGAPRDELTALAATLDGLLGRISAALRHEQRFSAEMAHELRTPLSGVRAEAEFALRHGAASVDARGARAGAGRHRPDGRGDRHAARRRPPRGNRPLGSSDAAAIVRSFARTRSAWSRPGSVPVGADQELVAAALHPLLENARRHAHSQVQVELARDGRRSRRQRQQRRRGDPAADAERIFAPGVERHGRRRPRAPARPPAGARRGRGCHRGRPEPRFELKLPAS